MKQVKEKWKDIVNYEGIYEVSNMGQIRKNPNHSFIKGCIKEPGYILKPISKGTKKGSGYMRVWLSTGDGKPAKIFSWHRLVAIAWIPNPSNLPEVNHKNEIKYDNCVDNLEWSTGVDNLISYYKNHKKSPLGLTLEQWKDLNM